MQELPITKVKETILKDLGKAEEKVKNCIGNCTQTELAFPVKAYFFQNLIGPSKDWKVCYLPSTI